MALCRRVGHVGRGGSYSIRCTIELRHHVIRYLEPSLRRTIHPWWRVVHLGSGWELTTLLHGMDLPLLFRHILSASDKINIQSRIWKRELALNTVHRRNSWNAVHGHLWRAQTILHLRIWHLIWHLARSILSRYCEILVVWHGIHIRRHLSNGTLHPSGIGRKTSLLRLIGVSLLK